LTFDCQYTSTKGETAYVSTLLYPCVSLAVLLVDILCDWCY